MHPGLNSATKCYYMYICITNAVDQKISYVDVANIKEDLTCSCLFEFIK